MEIFTQVHQSTECEFICSSRLFSGLRKLWSQVHRSTRSRPVSEANYKIHRKKLYVDDGLISFHSEEEAISLVHEAKQLCSTGKLRLHKFVSNSPQVLNLSLKKIV